MNRNHTLIIIAATAIQAVTPCLAVDLDVNQSVGLMGNQTATPVAVNDSAIQKAIQELIKRQEKQYVDIKKKIPVKLDNPVGEHPLRNPNLILGGAEITPM